jgi:hypothetical protein
MQTRRKFIAGSAAVMASPYLIRTAEATIIQSGNRIYYSTPPTLLDTVDPYTGVKTADLFVPNGTYQQSVNLSNFQGMSLVPQEAENIKVWCHLFRNIAGSVGQTDASLSLEIPGYIGSESLINLATAACTPIGSGAQCTSPGALVESIGLEVEYPNIVEADGNWGRFTWSIGGNTVVGSASWLRLTSFTVPNGYTLPSVWPAQNAGPSSLAMYFGASGFADASPFARAVTPYNSSIQPDGGANFNGLNTYLTFNCSGVTLSGDFTIEVTMSGSSKALQGGSQQRILSLGNGAGSPAIGIDQVGGGAILVNESTAVLKTGGNSLINGVKTNVKWRRASGINTLIVNGQQDGQPFTDNTAWALSSTAEIGRLNGNPGVGQFTGEIYFISIVSGVAI